MKKLQYDTQFSRKAKGLLGKIYLMFFAFSKKNTGDILKQQLHKISTLHFTFRNKTERKRVECYQARPNRRIEKGSEKKAFICTYGTSELGKQIVALYKLTILSPTRFKYTNKHNRCLSRQRNRPL